MPAEPVTATERSLIPREILTALAAFCFVMTVAAMAVAAAGWRRGALKDQLQNVDDRFTHDYAQFIISVAPFIPFIMIIAGAWNARRIAVFALGLFVFWAGMAIDLARSADNNRKHHTTGDGTTKGAKMLEAGLIVSIVFAMLSLLSISPRDTTRWWHRGSGATATQPAMHPVNPMAPTTLPRTHRRPFIAHYVLAALGFLIGLAGEAVLLENYRRDYRTLRGDSREGAVVLNYLYFIIIVVSFFGVATAFLCDSDIYAGFSLALNTLAIIFSLRFAVDVDNFAGGNMRRLLLAGLSLMFVGSLISSAGVMSRRSNLTVDRDVGTAAPNPALP